MRSAATRMSLVRIEEMHVKTMEQRLLEGVPSLLGQWRHPGDDNYKVTDTPIREVARSLAGYSNSDLQSELERTYRLDPISAARVVESTSSVREAYRKNEAGILQGADPTSYQHQQRI